MIDRRAFLTAAALTGGLTALTAGCTTEGDPAPAPDSSPAPSPAPSPVPSSSPSRPEPVPPDWPALRARLPGGLYLPGDPGYPGALRLYNPLFDGRRPAAVARCTRPEDVRACVEVAAAARIPVAARAGGHSYAGYSAPDGALVVDVRSMSGVAARADGTAVVDAGARLIDVHARLAAAGRCLPAGSCPTVGVAGLTLGGGIGVLARRFGLTCDRLVSARVVTAAADLVTASETEHPDLFWALRGGGGGNFGVVTSFTFATEAAPRLTVFALTFGGGAADVVGAWQDWVAGAPPELWSTCVLSAGSPPGVRVGGCFVGPAAACRAELGRLGVTPAGRTVMELDHLDAMRYFAGCVRLAVDRCRPADEGGALGRESFVASSRILRRAADPAEVVALLHRRTGLDLLLDSLGGAVADVAPTATAFPHRDALASAQIYANTDAGRQTAVTEVGEVRDGLGRLAGPYGYVNYIDPGLPDWASAYYGANLPRLREVAAAYDPDGVFAFAQGLTAPGR